MWADFPWLQFWCNRERRCILLLHALLLAGTLAYQQCRTLPLACYFLDVGQGLSILVQSDGQTMIYDGGDKSTSSFVVSYLQKQNVTTIDYLISSHYDSDHMAGLIGCLNAFDVKNVISSDYEHDSKLYQSFIQTVADKGLPMQHPAVGTEFSFGSGSFQILAPATIDPNDSNKNSVAIKLTNGDNSFIFTGDADPSTPGRLLPRKRTTVSKSARLGKRSRRTGLWWRDSMNR